MNKRMTLLRTVFIFLISSAGFTISQNSIAYETNFNTTKGKIKPLTILGYPPYLSSVGVAVGEKIDGVMVMKNELPTHLQVGDYLFIPRLADQNKNPRNLIRKNTTANSLYEFRDLDGDNLAVNTDDNDKRITIEWFILDHDGDWTEVTGWQDIKGKEKIKDNYILYLDGDQQIYEGVNALEIPPEAQGKRIGFTYIPESAIGFPRFGSKMYVWDIAYYFGQMESDKGWPCENNEMSGEVEGNPNSYPKDGNPFEPEQNCSNPGIKGSHNRYIPPDAVIRGNQDNLLSITITDMSEGRSTSGMTNEDEGFGFHVNTPYEAKLSFVNGRPFTQEMIDAPGATVQWIAYRLAEGADVDICKADNIDDRNNPSCFTREEVPALTATVDVDGNLVTTYTTQSTNADAKGNLKNVAPDYSEQGYWLEVEFDDGQD